MAYFQPVIETGGKRHTPRFATDPLGKRRLGFHNLPIFLSHLVCQSLPISYSSLIDCLTRVTARFAVRLAGCTEIAAEQQMFVWCGMCFFFWVMILFHKMLIRFDLEMLEIWSMISAWQGNLGTELFKYDEIWRCMMFDCSMLLRELPKLVISCHLMVLIGWPKMDMSPYCLIASCQVCHHSFPNNFLHWNPTIGILGILNIHKNSGVWSCFFVLALRLLTFWDVWMSTFPGLIGCRAWVQSLPGQKHESLPPKQSKRKHYQKHQNLYQKLCQPVQRMTFGKNWCETREST